MVKKYTSPLFWTIVLLVSMALFMASLIDFTGTQGQGVLPNITGSGTPGFIAIWVDNATPPPPGPPPGPGGGGPPGSTGRICEIGPNGIQTCTGN